jgi:integrase
LGNQAAGDGRNTSCRRNDPASSWSGDHLCRNDAMRGLLLDVPGLENVRYIAVEGLHMYDSQSCLTSVYHILLMLDKTVSRTAHELDEGTYMEPSKMTVAQWLDTWLIEYTKALKAYRLRNYQSQVKNHIKPFIGAVKVADLTPDIVQRMYNQLASECKLAPKTLRNIHGILHSAFETLSDIGEVCSNPCTACAKRLPKVMKKELHTLADDDLTRFMDTIEGNPLEYLFLVDLFTGLRQGELLGLRWSCVNVEKGCITIDRQLYMPEIGGQYLLQALENRKVRVLACAV